MKYFKIILIILIISTVFCDKLEAQNVYAEKITIVAKNQSLKDILSDISSQVNINFSYSNKEIDENKKTTLIARNQSVENVIKQLTNELNLKYTFVEKQVILKPNPKTTVKQEEIQPQQEPLKYTISGYIKDEETGEVLIGALIVVKSKNSSYASSSNAYGFYSMSIPSANYIANFSFLGYEKQSESFHLVGNIEHSISLKMNIEELKIVTVTEHDNSDLTRNNPLKNQRISSLEITKKPILGGDNDVIKSLQAVAGINLFGEGSVIFNVRGGDKGQNAVFIDEAPIYNPSHLLGFFSAIAPDAINSISVYKNDFPIQYGGRLSSMIDIRTKDGNMHKLGFDGNISPLLSTFSIDGPLKKEKSSFLITLRKSHLNYLYKKNIPNLSIDFYDFHIKYNLKINRENRIYFALYSGYDNLQINNSALRWKNNTFTFRWNHLFSDKMFSNSTFYTSSYKYSLFYSIPDDVYWTSDVKIVSFKNDFTYYKSSKHTIFFGFETSIRTFNPGNLNYGEYYINAVRASNVLDNTLYFGGEIRTKEKFSIKYGLRFLNWNNFGPTVIYNYNENYLIIDTIYQGLPIFNTYNRFEPRISGIWAFSEKFSTSFAYSHNVQFLQFLSNSISPFTTLDVWMPASTNIKPQTADQFSLGLFLKLPEIEFVSEFYLKQMNNQIDFSNQPSLFLNPFIESQLRFGKAYAYGTEFSLKKQKGTFKFVINYSYSRAFKQTNGINSSNIYPAMWDKPHNFYSNFSFDFSDRTSLNLTFVYFSGNRFSSPTGFYYYQNYTVPIYEEKNNDKLPDYHRLDVAFKWRLNKRNENRFEHFLTFSIYNFYGHKNVIAVNFNQIETANGEFLIPTNYVTENEIEPSSMSLLGFVPSVSYQFKFR
ncbi:MAG: TonB-dependent receptor [Bacteroidales bacterium]|nr:TonB-dependent receptor [Bacteroidales bacterium]